MNVISQSFNPLHYTSNNYLPDKLYKEKDTENFEEIVTKGGNKIFKVDINHLDKLCKSFYSKSHLKIKDLVGKDKDDFNLMVSYVNFLYGTNYYDKFYRKIEKHFSKLDKIIPGTIGAYFGGCLVSSFNQPGCSATCAGSIPRPKSDEGWSFCDRAVIFAENDKKGYSFDFLKKPKTEEELDNVYLFLEHTNLDDFKGFSKKEKRKLLELGIEKVHVIGCDEKEGQYTELYSSIHVRDIKSRKSKKSSSIFVLFLLFILLIFLWLCYSNSKLIISHF